MEALGALLALLLIGGVIGLPVWLIVQARRARREISSLQQRVNWLETQVLLHEEKVKERKADPEAQPSAPAAAAEPASETLERLTQFVKSRPLVAKPLPVVPVEPAAFEVIPPSPSPAPAAATTPVPERVKATAVPELKPLAMSPVAPPPLPPPPPKSPPPPITPRAPIPEPSPAPLLPKINWEQFLGVKLFAWIGGLAAFLGVVFFVKYSFDNNLVPPPLRVTIGFLAGLGCLVGGILMSRKNLTTLSQTLCATGVVILYAVTYACRSIYHFQFFDNTPLPAFALMVLITATAFLLAVRLDAMVVAILGMLGGFLTPVLVHSGQDNPLGLFGYIAILDAGLVLVAVNRKWSFLPALGALGTGIMQLGWAGEFFVEKKYFEGSRILIPLGILFGFVALFLASAGWAKRRAKLDEWLAGSVVGLVLLAFGFTVWFLHFPTVALRPVSIFGFVLLLDLALFGLKRIVEGDGRWAFLPALGAVGTCAVQVAWANMYFGEGRNTEGSGVLIVLGVLLGFVLLFTAATVWAKRQQRLDCWLPGCVAGMVAAAFGFTVWLLGFGPVSLHCGPIFGFVLALNLVLFGLVALLGKDRRWFLLPVLGVVGTGLIQIVWAGKFFTEGSHFEGNRIYVALGVLLGFIVVYLAAVGWAKKRGQLTGWLSGSFIGLVVVAFAFAGWFLTAPALAARPGLMFGFVFLVDLAVVGLVLIEKRLHLAITGAGLAVFGLLAMWTGRSLTNDLLNTGLGFYFLFAILHSLAPAWLRRQSGGTVPANSGQFFPPLAIALVLIPLFRLPEISFFVWPFVFIVDVLAIGLAVLTASLLSVGIVLILTLTATAALILKIPVALTGLPSSLFVLGAFSVFFVCAGLWLARRFKPAAFKGEMKSGEDFLLPENMAVGLPIMSAVLPFLLLIMATLRLPMTNPSPVFGLALLLVVLLLGITKLFSMEWMPLVGLLCVGALGSAWHFNRFDPHLAPVPLIWYLIFLAVFTVFPFLFLRRFSTKVAPWVAAALAGPMQFLLVHLVVKAAWPNNMMGLVPAAFAIPSLLGLVVLLKRIPAESPARMTQLAFFGGVALFFITLIFPIQFDNQWLTIAWALEGVALLWLFHRVPHPGLRVVGVGLLGTAFVRLAVNPQVFEYHMRSSTPIFNWYLYAYGIVTVCLFAGGKLMAPPRNKISGFNVPPWLAALGTVLAFWLLNIEIADYFGEPGSRLTFQFSGNFARDMTYSIAWASYALMLLVVGIARKLPACRYAGLALLSVTLLKLFLHDLAQLQQLYRIGAFIAVAVILMLASRAYERFFSTTTAAKETKDAPPAA